MTLSAAKKPVEQQFIDPARLYRRGYALKSLGLGLSIIRRARRKGIELDCVQVGKQRLCTGAAVIQFVERLAEATGGEVQS